MVLLPLLSKLLVAQVIDDKYASVNPLDALTARDISIEGQNVIYFTGCRFDPDQDVEIFFAITEDYIILLFPTEDSDPGKLDTSVILRDGLIYKRLSKDQLQLNFRFYPEDGNQSEGEPGSFPVIANEKIINSILLAFKTECAKCG